MRKTEEEEEEEEATKLAGASNTCVDSATPAGGGCQ